MEVGVTRCNHEHSTVGRSELRDVLDDLVLQKKEKDRQVDEDVEEAARELIEYSSPTRKKSYKQRRKRKRTQRDSISDTFSDEERETSSSEVITIYGRHLNLSRLGSCPSLYSICRDWVLNDPLGQQQQQLNMTNMNSSNHERSPSPLEGVETFNIEKPFPLENVKEIDKHMAKGLDDDQFELLKIEYLKKWKKCTK